MYKACWDYVKIKNRLSPYLGGAAAQPALNGRLT